MCVCVCAGLSGFSHGWLCDPGTGVRQAPLSMGFPRQNAGVGRHALLQGVFPTQGSTHIFCVSCILDRLFTHWATSEVLYMYNWTTLPYSWNQLSVVRQPPFSFKCCCCEHMQTCLQWVLCTLRQVHTCGRRAGSESEDRLLPNRFPLCPAISGIFPCLYLWLPVFFMLAFVVVYSVTLWFFSIRN